MKCKGETGEFRERQGLTRRMRDARKKAMRERADPRGNDRRNEERKCALCKIEIKDCLLKRALVRFCLEGDFDDGRRGMNGPF